MIVFMIVYVFFICNQALEEMNKSASQNAIFLIFLNMNGRKLNEMTEGRAG